MKPQENSRLCAAASIDVLNPGSSQAFVAAPSSPLIIITGQSRQTQSAHPRCASYAVARQGRSTARVGGREHGTVRKCSVAFPRVGGNGRAWRGRISSGVAVVMGDKESVHQQLGVDVQLGPRREAAAPSNTTTGTHDRPADNPLRGKRPARPPSAAVGKQRARSGGKGNACSNPNCAGGVGDEVVIKRQQAFVELVSRLGKQGRGHEVEQAMSKTRSEGSPPFNRFMCNACITALARCGRWRQALDVLDGMRRAAAEAYANGDLGAGPKGRELIVPDVFSYSAAITACGNAGQRRRALALLSDMRAEGVRPNVVSYNAAAHACIDSGGSRGGSTGLGSCRASVGNGISSSSAGEGWALVLGLMSEMRSEGVNPDAFTFSIAIAACGRAGQWQRALLLLDEMGREKEPLAPNVVAVNAAMAACARAGECDRALDLLRRMISAHRDGARTPDQSTGDPSDTIRGKCSENGIRDLQTEDGGDRGWPRPDAVSFNTAMQACAKAGRWRDGATFLRRMRDVGVRPDVRSYGATFACLRAGGQWTQALELLAEMKAGAPHGVHADLGCYGAVLSTLGEAGQWELALALLRRLEFDASAPPTEQNKDTSEIASQAEGGVRSIRGGTARISASAAEGPNLICFNAVLAACAQAGAWSPALSLLEEMEERGVYDIVSFNSAIHACRGQGQWQKAIALLDRMRNPESEVGLGTAARKADSSDATAVMKYRAGPGHVAGRGAGRPRILPAPDVYSFTSAITACGAAGQANRALQLLHEMEAAGVPPSVVPYNAAIAAVGRCVNRRPLQESTGESGTDNAGSRQSASESGDNIANTDTADEVVAPRQKPWECARALLGEMRAAGITPNTVSYNTVLAACQRAGAWQGALEVLEEMKQGIVVASGRSASGAGRNPSSFYSRSAEVVVGAVSTPSPDLFSFNTAIGACGRAGQWKEALVILDEISSRGFSPDVVSYHTTAAACSRAEEWDAALDVLNRGRRAGVVVADSAEKGLSKRDTRKAGARSQFDARFYSSVVAMVRRTHWRREGAFPEDLLGGDDLGRRVEGKTVR